MGTFLVGHLVGGKLLFESFSLGSKSFFFFFF